MTPSPVALGTAGPRIVHPLHDRPHPLTSRPPDAAAGASALPGDLHAFCDALLGRLVGALLLSTGDRALAEDLAQETLCRVCERWEQVRDMDSPEGWAFTVALNLSRSWWRRAGRGARALMRLEHDAGTRASADPVDLLGDRRWLLDAVAQLPPRQRQVIGLRFYADCSVADTAVAMGCAEGIVKSLTSKATAALRAALADQEDLT